MRTSKFPEIRLSRLAGEPIANGVGEASAIGEPNWPRYIRITDIRGLDKLKSEERMSLEPAIATRAEVRRDDILMAAVGATVGDAYIHQSDNAACFAGYLVRFRAEPSKAVPRFVAHWTQSSHYRHQIRSGYVGSTIENFSASKYRAMRIPLPTVATQQSIATFLDRETAKIDALIGKQEQLIATLRENRAATITQAVTKGLDSKIELTRSGLEALGNIPRAWKAIPVKRLGTVRYGIGEPPRYIERGTALIRATNVSCGRIEADGLVYVDPEDIPSKRILWLEEGDIVVVRSGAYTGDSAIIPTAYAGSIAGFDMVIRPSAIEPKFLQYALLSPYCKKAQIDVLRMRAAQPHLNAEELGNCQVLVPSATEQQAIVSHLDEQCAKIDALIDKSTVMIETLREYRSALITNAVTGKIDVREAV